MNILCTVCARGGSIELKNKNIKKLFNKPLILHTLLQAKKSRIFDKIIVSTDSNKIINICNRSRIITKFNAVIIISSPLR